MTATLPTRFFCRVRISTGAVLAAIALACVPPAQAGPGHVHGQAQLDVMWEGAKLVIELSIPMEVLVGFERAPRHETEQNQIRQALERISQLNTLLRPDKAAQCDMGTPDIDTPAFMRDTAMKPSAEGHADLRARAEFRCSGPEALASLEVSLFDAFSRLRRVEARVVHRSGQHAQSLTRANRVLRLTGAGKS